MYNSIIIIFIASVITNAAPLSAQLPSGHSHNDYRQARPLWDAIENHFISIEVDIHLVSDALLVGHDEEDLSVDMTLQSMYLMPLRSYIAAHNGWVYPDCELILLIDIKTDADSTYQLLREVLVEYSDILTSYSSDNVERRAVSVVISGNRPRDLMLNEKIRYGTYDGRIDDINDGSVSNIIILVSDNWGKHFTWRGKGSMSKADRHRLTTIIKDAHSKGYKIRFWNLPTKDQVTRQDVWNELMSLGVDLINVDDLKAYRDFFVNEFMK